jgi:hypothetical protein
VTKSAPDKAADSAVAPPETPAANSQLAANAPAAEPGASPQPASSPLYNQATPADRAAAREADGAKPTENGAAVNNQLIAAITPPTEQNETAQPAPAVSSADQAASGNGSSPQPGDRNGPQSDNLASAEPAQEPSEASRDLDDPVWPQPVMGPSLADASAELSIPDEQALSADYRPWRSVKLADGSQTAVYLALDAVPQWADPPTPAPAGADEAQLPAPAVPYYFGGGEIVTSIAE